jgi:hypothetical protein
MFSCTKKALRRTKNIKNDFIIENNNNVNQSADLSGTKVQAFYK